MLSRELVAVRPWALACAWAACTWVSVSATLLPLEVERLHAGVGGFAVMNCHLDFPFGIEIPFHLQWDKDAEVIFSWYSNEPGARAADRWGGRVRLASGAGLGRAALNVSSVRETDAGLYRCRVSFPNRTPPSRNNGTFYYLDVDGGNLIATPPTNVTMVEGERAELECGPKDPEATVEWFRDDTPLSSIPAVASRAERPHNGSLILRAAEAGDAGLYACRVSDGSASQSSAAYLDVHYKAKVVYMPEERYLPLGKPASLDCHFSANPPLTNLRWEKDGFLFDPYNVPGVFYSRNGSLLFNRVDESHEGLYGCTAYNALGTAGASPAVRVRVQRPPALHVRPRALVLTRVGNSLTLRCQPVTAPAHDQPMLQWSRKDGRPLPEGRHVLEGGNLTITDVSEEDGGIYVCTVSNEAASVSAESDLVVENAPPRAPHRVTARPGPGTLHITWLPGYSGVEAEHEVWYRWRAGSEWRSVAVSRGAAAATLRLRPATEYEVRVLAQDHLGDTLFSRPIFVKTLDVEAENDAVGGEEAAFAAVTESDVTDEEVEDVLEVSIRQVDEGALVMWKGGGAGREERCELRWLTDDEPPRLLLTAHTHHDHMLVGEVVAGSQYRARVRCGSRGGSARLAAAGGRGGAVLGAAAAAAVLAALAGAAWAWRRRAADQRARR